MPEDTFRVQQIDHVELIVPDRHEAARWYERVLGLQIVNDFAFWADDPNGPLMIASASGGTMLALFAGKPRGSQRGVSHWRVAFRVDGPGFLAFLARLEDISLQNDDGETLTAAHEVDHDRSYSIYFVDPFGYQYEITTYEYDFVRTRL